MFTTAPHLSLCRTKLIKCTTSYRISWISILIFSSSLRLSSPSGVCLQSSPSELGMPFTFLHSFTSPVLLVLSDLICSLNNYFALIWGFCVRNKQHATGYSSNWLLNTRINIDQGISTCCTSRCLVYIVVSCLVCIVVSCLCIAVSCLVCIVVSCLVCIVVSCLVCIVVSWLVCIVVSCLVCIVVSCLVCIVYSLVCIVVVVYCVCCCFYFRCRTAC